MARFNHRYFAQKREESGLTYRAIGEIIGLDHALVHRMLSGLRKMSVAEAAKIAELFRVSVDEIARNAGFASQGELDLKPAPDTIPIGGWVDDQLLIRWEAPKGVKTASKPTGAPKSVEVVRFLTSGTKLDALDGALAYFVRAKGMSPDCVGRQCVVSLDPDRQEADVQRSLGKLGRGFSYSPIDPITDKTRRRQTKEEHEANVFWFCCVVRKGQFAGAYKLTHLNGDPLIENAVLETASLVNWIKF